MSSEVGRTWLPRVTSASALVVTLLLVASSLSAHPVAAYQATPVNESQYVIAKGFQVAKVFTDLAGVRGLTPDPLSSAVLAVHVGARRVSCLFANATRQQPALDFQSTGDSFPNHGIAVDAERKLMYLSSPDKIYRWPWTGCDPRTPVVSSAPVVVVADMPVNGHYSRTLEPNGEFLYVSIGSWGNLVAGENRAAVYRYSLDSLAAITDTPLPFPGGAETVAIGMRNSVGIRFGDGGMWSVENGSDDLEREDLGGDIHTDNPGEEINLTPISPLPANPQNYGFPLCFSEFLLDTLGFQNTTRGTQWSVTSINYTASAANDEICRDPSQNTAPLFLLPPHIAPLDLAVVKSDAGKFSKGDIVVSAHGSWNRSPPQGYGVYLVRGLAKPPFRLPADAKYELIFGDSDVTKCLKQEERQKCLRPVGVVVDSEGAVWVSMDSIGQVVRMVPDPLNIGIQAVMEGEGGVGGLVTVTTATSLPATTATSLPATTATNMPITTATSLPIITTTRPSAGLRQYVGLGTVGVIASVLLALL